MTARTEPDEAGLVLRLRAAGCVFAEDEARLLVEAARTPAELEQMVAQRVEGLPLEQILGWAEFRGLRIVVEPGVFVPRRRTEYLVEQALALLHPPAVVLDLCCGSGAVGAALAHGAGPLDLYAADIEPAAVRCARRNLAPYGGRVFAGDLFAPLPAGLAGRVDVLAVNAPYVPTAAVGLMPPEARVHEPRSALDGGVDGLDVHRRVLAEAPRWLAPGGHLLIETSVRQAPVAVALMAAAGLAARSVSAEESAATVVIGTRRRG